MRRRLLALASALIALAALVAIFWRLDWREAAGVMRRTGVWGTAAFTALTAGILFSQTLGWHALMRARGWRIPLRTTAVAMLMGNALAYVTPSMYLGGEPLRIWYIGSRFGLQKRDVAATVLVHKFAEFAGFIVALLVCTGTMLWTFDLPAGIRVGSTAVSAFLLVVFLVLMAGFIGRWPLTSGLLRIFGKRAAGLRAKAEDMEGQIEATFRDHRGPFALCLVLTGGTAPLVVLRPLLFFVFAGRALPFPDLALLFVLTQIILAFQFTPGGLGIFEGGLIGAFALIGLGAPEAMAYAVTQRLTDAVIVGAGVALAGKEGLSGFFSGKRPDGDRGGGAAG